jgi:HD-GYP domain-containing protein (c-di-GMP phosphodiesterase class II)/DNA-binding CsgD family transcriptional regulator
VTGVRAATDARLAEVLTALALATDVGNGLPMEKSLRDAIIAARLADAVGLEAEQRRAVYYTALLRSLGCTAFAHENAAILGGDDLAFHALYQRLDPGHPGEFVRDVVTGMGAWAGPVTRARTVLRFLRVAPTVGPRAARSACEVSASLARRLDMSQVVLDGLDHIYERWDGKGIPDGVAGEDLSIAARFTHLADIVEIAHRAGGVEGAVALVERRRGGHLDPSLADAFLPLAGDILGDLDEVDALVVALDAEPPPRSRIPAGELARFAGAVADFADLKSPWTLSHSSTVADLAARASDETDREQVRLAALVHDLGRVSVPNGIWDKPASLTSGELECVRLHPYYTHRILTRAAPFADVAPLASSDHERLDGSGYHRGLGEESISPPMRVLAAADAYAAMTADRPHRRALEPDAAARTLRAEVRAGKHCADAVEAVLEAAGHTPERRDPWPCGLTEREVEVLRLAARGLTNKEIAAELFVSPRTVQHHLGHVYGKIDRRTRAGAAMFAMENGLVGRAE